MSSFRRTRGINMLALIAITFCIVAWQPPKVRAAGGGTASWSDGGYADRRTVYYYHVAGAPPNMCGALNLVRNGNVEGTGIGWICTDNNGNATKGPWGPPTSNETAQGIYIRWADNSTTTGGEVHINDVSDPTITAYQSGGIGIPIPNGFSGTATDTQWGTGFKFGIGGWSYVYAAFYKTMSPSDPRPDKYWNGSSYSSSTEMPFNASISPPGGGYSIIWSVTPPPVNAHSATDTYVWCVYTKDRFYPAFNCIYFHGPR